jgi:hypothetical protein
MCSRRAHLQRCPLDGKRRFRDKREAIVALHGAVTVRRRIEAGAQTLGGRCAGPASAGCAADGTSDEPRGAYAGLREPPGLVTTKIA